jgi:hypothetical protein
MIETWRAHHDGTLKFMAPRLRPAGRTTTLGFQYKVGQMSPLRRVIFRALALDYLIPLPSTLPLPLPPPQLLPLCGTFPDTYYLGLSRNSQSL